METRDELEHQYFMLQMKDTWDTNDYRYADELRAKIINFREEQ